MAYLRMQQENFTPRKASEKQETASRRNYALMQLRMMKSHLYQVEGQVDIDLFRDLQNAIEDCCICVEKRIENGKANKN